MAKIKSVSNYNGTSWDTPIPLGANDENIDITSATTDIDDGSSAAGSLINSAVTVAEGDTDATAWSKFNKFRHRVYNAFNGVAGVSVASSYASSGGNSKVYNAAYINSYMNNVIGYSGATVPAKGSIMDQLSTKFELAELSAIADNTDLNSITTAGMYCGLSSRTYSNAPVSSAAFTLRVFHSTGGAVSTSQYRAQLWITAWGSTSTSSNIIFIRFTSDRGTTWGPWRRIVFTQDLDNYVDKSGDTMTGNLTFNGGSRNIFKSTIDVTSAPSSSVTVVNQSDFVDKNNVQYAYIRGRYSSDTNLGLQLGSTRNGVNNLLAFNIDASNNRTIQLSDAAIWRKALGIGTDGAMPITMSQGGTGQTSLYTTTTQSSIIASKTSGVTVSAVSWRQWGKCAQIRIALTYNTALTTSGKNLLTIVGGKCPPGDMALSLFKPYATVGSAVLLSTGAINVYANVAANTEMIILGTYFLA